MITTILLQLGPAKVNKVKNFQDFVTSRNVQYH